MENKLSNHLNKINENENFIFSFDHLNYMDEQFSNYSDEIKNKINVLKSIKENIINSLCKNYDIHIENNTNKNLIFLKKQLVNWIHEDYKKLNKIDVFKFFDENTKTYKVQMYDKNYDENGNLQLIKKPYILQGKEREKIEYLHSKNKNNLNIILDYFINFLELYKIIKNIFSIKQNSEPDYELIISFDDWKPIII